MLLLLTFVGNKAFYVHLKLYENVTCFKWYTSLHPLVDSTLPSIETPYPMLVLVGPQGSGKKDLAMKLVEEFSDYFGYG